eukprot:PhF_6_TR6035/c0_g1_i2/m.8715/K07759/PARG; poly(ADP-ribose) glycohydrolase
MFSVFELPSDAAFPDTSTFTYALKQYCGVMSVTPESFYENVVPKITTWASQAIHTTPTLPLLPSGSPGIATISRRGVRNLLALSLFKPLIVKSASSPGPTKTRLAYGDVSWHRLLKSTASEAVERLACLIHYFYRCVEEESDEALQAETVTYERFCLANAKVADVIGDAKPLTTVTFTGATRIEDLQGAGGHVNFANKQLSLGIIPSCTQEEVLFSFRPEMYPAILLVETLESNEAVIFRGCRKMCSYTGYLSSFAFSGDGRDPPHDPIPEVIGIDAVVNFGGMESTREANERDVVKAYIGFQGVKPGAIIATGNWGCGAFGGSVDLKFAQQWLAASMCGHPLMYSPFRPEFEQVVTQLYSGLKGKNLTTHDIWKILLDFSQA